MKRILEKSLVICLLFLLCACAAEKEAQYDEKTNQTVSVHGIRFQIPQQWNKSYENGEYLEYSIWDEEDKYPERCLAITMEKRGNLKEDAESRVEALEFAKEDDEIDYHLGNISETATSIGKLDAQIIAFDGKVKDKKYLYKDVLIETENGIVHLDFCSLDKIGMKDFDRVIDSITLAE